MIVTWMPRMMDIFAFREKSSGTADGKQSDERPMIQRKPQKGCVSETWQGLSDLYDPINNVVGRWSGEQLIEGMPNRPRGILILSHQDKKVACPSICSQQ
jgi:hypothetical protein